MSKGFRVSRLERHLQTAVHYSTIHNKERETVLIHQLRTTQKHRAYIYMWECYSEVKCIAIYYKLMQLEVLVLRETSQITHQVLNDFPDGILTRWCDRLQRQGLGKIGG